MVSAMAGVVERPKTDGTVTYQVKWRQDGAWQSERFGDAEGATRFKGLVEAHGGQWPHGWVRGQGSVEEPGVPGDIPLDSYATRYVDRLTGIDERTREDYHRKIRIHLSLLRQTDHAGREYPATICTLTPDDVTDWVRAEAAGEKDAEAPLPPRSGRDGLPTPRASRTGTDCCTASSRPPSTPSTSSAAASATRSSMSTRPAEDGGTHGTAGYGHALGEGALVPAAALPVRGDLRGHLCASPANLERASGHHHLPLCAEGRSAIMAAPWEARERKIEAGRGAGKTIFPKNPGVSSSDR